MSQAPSSVSSAPPLHADDPARIEAATCLLTTDPGPPAALIGWKRWWYVLQEASDRAERHAMARFRQPPGGG